MLNKISTSIKLTFSILFILLAFYASFFQERMIPALGSVLIQLLRFPLEFTVIPLDLPALFEFFIGLVVIIGFYSLAACVLYRAFQTFNKICKHTFRKPKPSD